MGKSTIPESSYNGNVRTGFTDKLKKCAVGDCFTIEVNGSRHFLKLAKKIGMRIVYKMIEPNKAKIWRVE